MGRLDDIIKRNQPRQGGGGGLGELLDTHDPLDTPEDRRRNNLAWVIVVGVVAAIVLLVVLLR